MSETRSEISLLVVFADLSRFGVQSQRVGDAEVAESLEAFYEQVGASVALAGGRVVKCLGDAVLLVFDEAHVDRGVETLLALKDAVDRAMARRGWECRLLVKAHFGAVIAGPFGPAGDQRWDVLGKTVNTAAALPATGIALSVAAFRKLGPALRRRFKKHTPPVTYIRLEDRRT
jgi:class 3 adenylate cyclase